MTFQNKQFGEIQRDVYFFTYNITTCTRNKKKSYLRTIRQNYLYTKILVHDIKLMKELKYLVQ